MQGQNPRVAISHLIDVEAGLGHVGSYEAVEPRTGIIVMLTFPVFSAPVSTTSTTDGILFLLPCDLPPYRNGRLALCQRLPELAKLRIVALLLQG